MTKIIADQRERNSGIPTEIARNHIDLEIKQLNIADYIIQTKNREGTILNIGLERKTVNDFINSIIDKRIITQLIILKENFDIPILIIEGDENIYKIRKMHPNAIRGMLASIAIDFQVPIIYTRNFRDTSSFLIVVAKRLEKERPSISLLDRRKPLTPKEQQVYLIESLPGVGPTIAKFLLKKFKTIKNLINASEKELQEVEKIGKKKAKIIKELLDLEYTEN